jgi:hypothetical protein
MTSRASPEFGWQLPPAHRVRSTARSRGSRVSGEGGRSRFVVCASPIATGIASIRFGQRLRWLNVSATGMLGQVFASRDNASEQRNVRRREAASGNRPALPFRARQG